VMGWPRRVVRSLARVEVEEVCCPVREQLQRGCGPRGGVVGGRGALGG